MVCAPLSKPAGIVMLFEKVPSSPTVAEPSDTGVECNSRSTLVPGIHPLPDTVKEEPAAGAPLSTDAWSSVGVVDVVVGGSVVVDATVVVVGTNVVVVVVVGAAVVVVGATVVVVGPALVVDVVPAGA